MPHPTQFGEPAVETLLWAIEHWSTREEAVEALGAVDEIARTGPLYRALVAPEARHAGLVAMATAKSGGPEAVRTLFRAAAEEVLQRLQEDLDAAFAKIDNPLAVRPLTAALRNHPRVWC